MRVRVRGGEGFGLGVVWSQGRRGGEGAVARHKRRGIERREGGRECEVGGGGRGGEGGCCGVEGALWGLWWC